MPNLLRSRRRSLSMTSMLFAASAISASVGLLFACSSSDSGTPLPAVNGNPPDSGASPAEAGSLTETGTQPDTGSPVDASDAGVVDAADSGELTLTVENYLSWCTVSVNGAATSSAATQMINVQPNTVVNLSGDTASAAFVWGYWYGTAGDTTAAHDTSKVTTVTVTTNKKIQACCPLVGAPTTPCPPPM